MITLKTKTAIVVFLVMSVNILSFARKTDYKIKLPFDSITQKYAYTHIVETPELNDSQLYILAKQWTKQKYGDAQYLIDDPNEQLADFGNFAIQYAYNKLSTPYTFNVNYHLRLQFKNGKYKIEINDIKLILQTNQNTREQSIEHFQKEQESVILARNTVKRIIAEIFNKIDANFQDLITEIENSMSNKNLNNNW